MSLEFVTLHTLSRITAKRREKRNVTIAYNIRTKEFSLLGNIEHSTILVIDQELIDNLQQILDKEAK